MWGNGKLHIPLTAGSVKFIRPLHGAMGQCLISETMPRDPKIALLSLFRGNSPGIQGNFACSGVEAAEI